MTKRYKPKKLTPVDSLVVVSVCLFLLAVFIAITAHGQVTFKDGSDRLGLKLVLKLENAAAWADFNNDDFVDLCAGSVLWQNDSAKRFTEIAKPGKAVLADLDNDDFIDLFSWSQRKLFRNVNGSELSEVNLPALPNSVSRGACWGDFNGDGYLDLYVSGYEKTRNGPGYPDFILMNVEDLQNPAQRKFNLAWQQPRERQNKANHGRGVTACDFDQDCDLDIYVSNYCLHPNLLWVNEGTVPMKDAAADYNAVATSKPFSGGHSIGAAWGDFDNDGLFDLFVGNYAHPKDFFGPGRPPKRHPESRFLRNLGPEKNYTFQDLGQCGIYYQESYATPAAGDYDNDGDLDLFFTTVEEITSCKKKNFPVLFSNVSNDGNWIFTDVTEQAGLSKLPPTYQVAWADFDNDGDLDLVTAGRLFVNQGNTNNWLKVHLQGDGKQVNRSAIGAQVRIKLKDRTLTRQVEAGTGQGNQNDLTLHFGLGTHNKPVNLEIFWPNGTCQMVEQVCPNQTKSVQFAETK